MDKQAAGFAEEAIRAVGRLDVASARMAIAEASDIDPNVAPLADAVYYACAEIEEKDRGTTETWNVLADAVDSHELVAVVESCRT